MGGMGDRALTPRLPTRSWSCDLDTLARLHRGLRDLDVVGENATRDTRADDSSAAGSNAARDNRTARDNGATRESAARDNGAARNYGVARDNGAARNYGAARDNGTTRNNGAARDNGAARSGHGEAAAREARLRAMLAGRMRAARALNRPIGPSPAAPAVPDPVVAAIRDTFRYIDAAGDRALRFFYGHLFARQPKLREMFPPAMDEQRDRLFRVLVRIVDSLPDPEQMNAYLTQLGRDHRKYLIEPDMYDAAGAALIATLRTFAGGAFTPEAERAWTQVYQASSALMLKAAEQDATGPGPASLAARVVAVEHRSDSVAVLTIAPDRPLPYTAGQHVTVQTPRWPKVWRSYSVACSPRDDGLLLLHVRAVPGGWVSSALVHHSPPGTLLQIGPPLGTMTLAPAGVRDLLCVAGGTGLSPVKAIIEQAVRDPAGTASRQIYLYYGARHRAGLYDLRDLWRLVDEHKGLHLIPVTSDDPAFDGMQGNVGRVAARYLPHTGCEAYVAGPPDMVRDTVQVLGHAGLRRERIHYDHALLA